jgi:hypothetical protein
MISVRSFLLALMMLAFSAASFAQVRISVTIAPPRTARLRTAYLSRGWLHLDPWILGLG